MDIETTLSECLDILTIILHNIEMGGDENYSPFAVERYQLKNLLGDYAQVAAGLGAFSERVEKVSNPKAAIEQTEDGRPALLDVIRGE